MKIPCDSIGYNQAKELYNKHITIQENATGRIFPAFVIDYCFEDQKGLILRIPKIEVLDLIEKYLMMDSEQTLGFVELDARNIFQGKYFSLVEQLH